MLGRPRPRSPGRNRHPWAAFALILDGDRLLPWLLISTLINVLFWSSWWLASGGVSGRYLGQARQAMDSYLEVHLERQPEQVPRTRQPLQALTLATPRALGAAHPSTPVAPQVAKNSLAPEVLQAYLAHWQEQVVAAGNRELAGGQMPAGRVIVAVTLAPDGRLIAIKILGPDAQSPLAQAVTRIIAAAAPFAPLPAPWQQPPQNLRIVRTWNFEP